MNQMLKRLKIKYLLATLLSVTILFLVIIQMFYYNRFNEISENTVKDYTDNIINNIADKIYTTLDDISSVSKVISLNSSVQQYLYSKNESERYVASPFVQDILNAASSLNKNVVHIRLEEISGSFIGSGNYIDNIKMHQKIYDVVNLSNPDLSMISYNIYDEFTGEVIFVFVNRVLYNRGGDDQNELIGFCSIVCESDHIQKLVESISLTENSKLFILSQDGTILASNNQELKPGQKFNDNNSSLPNEIGFDTRNNVIQYRDIETTGWKIVSVIPKKEITSDIDNLRYLGLIVGGIMSLIIFLAIVIINNNISSPVNKLVKFMEQAGTGKKERVDITYNNEIGILADYINQMLSRMEDGTTKIFQTQSRLYEAELAKKQAELSALQSQVNPHFLYNTLECLSGIGAENNIKEIETITSSLAKMFRYSIKESEFVSIKSELACIKNYLAIMSIRYNDKFDTKIEIDDSLQEKQILRMTLQPIIENAIYHGLERKSGKGVLIIKGSINDMNIISIEISDDGYGMPEETMRELNFTFDNNFTDTIYHKNHTNRSIGLKNINARIKLVYGKEYGLKIRSSDADGTTVIIYFPAHIESSRDKINT